VAVSTSASIHDVSCTAALPDLPGSVHIPMCQIPGVVAAQVTSNAVVDSARAGRSGRESSSSRPPHGRRRSVGRSGCRNEACAGGASGGVAHAAELCQDIFQACACAGAVCVVEGEIGVLQEVLLGGAGWVRGGLFC
jgi:hypothetical protein